MYLIGTIHGRLKINEATLIIFRGEERLLALSFPIVCLSVRTYQLGFHRKGFSRNFQTNFFNENPSRIPNLVKIGQEYRALYMKTSTFRIAGDNKSLQASRCRMQ
jgi:hypothetical protein